MTVTNQVGRRLVMLVGVVSLIFATGIEPQPLAAASQFTISGQARTPLQRTLQAALMRRTLQGLSVPPTVSFEHALTTAPDETWVLLGTTRVHFEGPTQASYERWPAFVVEEEIPPGVVGTVRPGDYSQMIRTTLARAQPGIWTQYDFGYEPRTYTFRERLELTLPASKSTLSATDNLSSLDTTKNLVFGFSTSGPRVNYTIFEEWETCVVVICTTVGSIEAGLRLDWDIGLRLPVAATLTRPVPTPTDYVSISSVTPLNWSESQYLQAGLEGVGGNEFLFQYDVFIGGKASAFDIDVIDLALDGKYDASQSFTPTIGSGNPFPLTKIDLPPSVSGLEYDVLPGLALGVGLEIDPSITAKSVSAIWQGSGAAMGTGLVSHTQAGVPFSVGPITLDPDSSPFSNLTLSGFRYNFDQFLIGLDGYVVLTLFGFQPRTDPFDIQDFDLSSVSEGQWLEIFDGTPSSLSVSVGDGAVAAIFLPLLMKN